MKTYTEDQMKDAFEQSRLTHPMVGFKYDTFEDFIKTIPVSLSEREQTVKDGFEKILENQIRIGKELDAPLSEICLIEGILSEYRSLSPCKEKWISVEEVDKLPDNSLDVLFFTASRSVYCGYYKRNTNKFHVYGINGRVLEDVQITHWQPLPSPPTGDNKKG